MVSNRSSVQLLISKLETEDDYGLSCLSRDVK